MAKIIAPNKEYNGVSAGVAFIDGIGRTFDSNLQNWFREHGYGVEEEKLTPDVGDTSFEWASEEEPPSWSPEEKPEPKKRTRKRGGK